MIESGKANGLNGQEYIETLLSERPKRREDDYLDDLMPRRLLCVYRFK